MRALIAKELYQLRGFFTLIGVLALLAAATTCFEVVAPALSPASDVARALQSSAVFNGVIILAAALRSVPEELRGGQIAFLDALPIGRHHLFAAKLVAMLALIAALIGVDTSIVALELSLAGPAVGDEAATMASVALIEVVVCFAAAGLGFLLSWAGTLGWFVAGTGLMILEVARRFQPGVREISLAAIDRLHFEPGAVVIPERFAATWLATGLIALAAGGLVFRAPGDLFGRLQFHGSRRLTSVAAVFVVGLLGLVAALTAWLGGGYLGSERGETRTHEVARLLISESDAEGARELLARAEEIDRRVGELFGGIERPELVVELKPPGRTHLGDFAEGKLRVPPGPAGPAIFAHELSHAYAWALTREASAAAGGGWIREGARLEWWRFYSEGLASWVEGQVHPGSPEAARLQRQAGRIRHLDHHDLHLLLDDVAHRARYDTSEAYALGMIFVEAVVETGGRDKPACILRAIGERSGDARSALELWLGVMERCGLDLGSVAERYEALLEVARASVPPPPRLPEGRPALTGAGMVIDVWRPGVGPLWCNFRLAEADALETYQASPAQRNGDCEVPELLAAEPVLSFQVGVQLAEDGALFGEWVTRPVPVERRCETLGCLEAIGRISRWAPSAGAPAPTRAGPGRGCRARALTSAAFSAGGELLATGDVDGVVCLWSATDGALVGIHPREEVAIEEPGSPGQAAVRALSFSRDGRLLLVETERGVSLLDVRTAGVWSSLPAASDGPRTVLHPEYAALIAVEPGRVRSSGEQGAVRRAPMLGDQVGVLDLARLGRLAILRASRPTGDGGLPIERLMIEPDGRHLQLATTNALLRHELATGARTELLTLEAPPLALALSQDGRRAAIADRTGHLRVLEVEGGAVIFDRILPAGSSRPSLAFEGDGALLVAGLGEGVRRLHEGELVTLSHEPPTHLVAAASNGARFFASAQGGVITHRGDRRVPLLEAEAPAAAGARELQDRQLPAPGAGRRPR